MILADIGNTNFHIYENGEIYNMKAPKKYNKKIYYISVNEEKEKKFVKLNSSAVNLKKYVKFNTNYKNMGIDRIMACKTVENGIVIDAGSAITIDIMKNYKHFGGIIAPGIFAFKDAFAKISKVLNMNVKFFCVDKPAQNTNEALLAGSIGLVVNYIKQYKVPYFFTGGDGKFLSAFVNGTYIKDLVFKGMIKTIKEDL